MRKIVFFFYHALRQENFSQISLCVLRNSYLLGCRQYINYHYEFHLLLLFDFSIHSQHRLTIIRKSQKFLGIPNALDFTRMRYDEIYFRLQEKRIKEEKFNKENIHHSERVCGFVCPFNLQQKASILSTMHIVNHTYSMCDNIYE